MLNVYLRQPERFMDDRKKPVNILALFTLSALLPGAALADDEVDGVIDSVDAETRSVVVNGVSYYVDEDTDYDDDLERFEDLRAGLRVEIDYEVRGERPFIVEIEIDD